MKVEKLIKPIIHYVDVEKVSESIQKLSLEDLLTYLSEYGILAWKLSSKLFVAFDHETKHKNFYRVSAVSIPLNDENLLKLALERAYGVKLYTEQDLRNILRGLVIHREYTHALRFVAPCRTEVKAINKNKRIVGVVDLICGNYIIEIKSSFTFRKEHMYQLLIYMDILNKPHGFLVYYDKIFKLSLKNYQNTLLEAYKRLYEIYHKTSSLIKDITYYKYNTIKILGDTKVEFLIQKLNELNYFNL